jgi:hypothetical protein
MLATRLRATSLHHVAGAAMLAVCSAGCRTRRLAGEPRQGSSDIDALPVNDCESSRAHNPLADLEVHRGPPMAMTATERSRVLRERRACGKIVLTVVVSEDELGEIARAGYAEAASTDRKVREAAVSLFLCDAVWGLMQ